MDRALDRVAAIRAAHQHTGHVSRADRSRTSAKAASLSAWLGAHGDRIGRPAGQRGCKRKRTIGRQRQRVRLVVKQYHARAGAQPLYGATHRVLLRRREANGPTG